MTRAQRRAYRELFPLYGLTYKHGEFLDLGAEPLALEIGFGMGENLLANASAHPEIPYLGIEAHKPGIANALARLHEQELKNVRLMRGDARLVLADHVNGRALRSVHVLFPDPWPKDSDTHRRLIQPSFLDLLAERLVPGGTLQIATDSAPYAAYLENLMPAQVDWEEISPVPRPLVSRYEQKALDASSAIHEFAFRTN